jgi:Ni/Co efflux regulator RcnB
MKKLIAVIVAVSLLGASMAGAGSRAIWATKSGPVQSDTVTP